MCKAGFAGDDAPRAVFRKCPTLLNRLSRLDSPLFIDIREIAY